MVSMANLIEIKDDNHCIGFEWQSFEIGEYRGNLGKKRLEPSYMEPLEPLTTAELISNNSSSPVKPHSKRGGEISVAEQQPE